MIGPSSPPCFSSSYWFIGDFRRVYMNDFQVKICFLRIFEIFNFLEARDWSVESPMFFLVRAG